MADKLVKLERIELKGHPTLNEKWVQEQIALDPSILELGDLILKDKERIQPGAGRLDLLLQDSDSNRRYEAEIQLGKTDESHIIRTIEYWDIEKKRYPQYDHCAVIVAEEITSRFLNVIQLFNGTIPLIALQMKAYKVGEGVALTFTKVVDEIHFGLLDEDEDVAEPTNREYWENLGSKKTVQLADKLLMIINEIDPHFELKYNKFYIGLIRDTKVENFVVFRAKKNNIRVEISLSQSDEIKKKLEEADLDLMDYDVRYGRYRIRLTEKDIDSNREFLKFLFEQSHKENFS